jgi:hypothetical protein
MTVDFTKIEDADGLNIIFKDDSDLDLFHEYSIDNPKVDEEKETITYSLRFNGRMEPVRNLRGNVVGYAYIK